MTWRPEFPVPARKGPWVEKGSCGHTIASGGEGPDGAAPAVYQKPYPCDACKKAQGES